jgi:DeoR/GlpR family transcriptional regulator of sugar metabolism
MRFIATFCRITPPYIKKYVLDLIIEQDQACITELAEKLQVSADTIRRDLTDLEKRAWHKRTTAVRLRSISPA